MKQDFKILVRHFLTYGIGIYLGKFIGFFMIPIYTTYLSPADYGVLELLDLTMYLFAMFVGLGIGNAVIRFYADCRSDGEKSEIVSTAMGYAAALAVVFGAAMLYLAAPVSEFIFSTGSESSYNRSELAECLRIITGSQILELISVTGIAYLQAEKKSIVFTIASISKFIIAVSLNILFIVGMGLGVKGVLYSGLISNTGFLVAMIILIRRRLAWRISFVMARQMIRYGAPLIVSTLSMFVIHFSDRFFLERFVGLDRLGIYSLSYRFAMVLPALIYAPFDMIWNAQMFDLQKKGEDGRRTINLFNRYILIGSLLIIIPYALSIQNIITVMADEKFHAAYRVVPVLLVAFLFIGLSATSSVGTYFAKRTEYRGLATGYGAIVALAGNYFLIKQFGYWGAVIATLLAFLVRYVALSIYSQRFYPLDYQAPFYLKVILSAAAAYVTGSAISIPGPVIETIVRSLVGAAIYLVLLRITGVISAYEVAAARSMIKSVIRREGRRQ